MNVASIPYGTFRMVPRLGSRLSEEEIRTALLLQRLAVPEKVSCSGTRLVRVEALVPRASSLEAAHGNWTGAGLQQTVTPSGLPRQPPDAKTPRPLWRVTLEAVEVQSGGMSSYYGFQGFFLSLLVALDRGGKGSLWDARGEKAT